MIFCVERPAVVCCRPDDRFTGTDMNRKPHFRAALMLAALVFSLSATQWPATAQSVKKAAERNRGAEEAAPRDAKERKAELRRLRRGAQNGDAAAMRRLAEAYERGLLGLKPSPRKAAQWYRRAAQRGDAEAQYRLARLVHRGAPGIRQSPTTAVVLYRAAAKRGHPEAMYWLGWCFEHGEGTEKDHVQALEWYQRAARKGNADALNAAGLLHLTGRGTRRDLDRARELFSRAAAAGSPWGMNNLAGLYEMGWGVARDPKKARELYEKAAAAGLRVARRNLARMKRRMAPGEEKPSAGNAAATNKGQPAVAGGKEPLRSGTPR